MEIKICGITSFEDGLAAVEAGANVLGFNFYPPSPRCLTQQACAEIVNKLRQALDERATSVIYAGVFVNTGPDQVISILQECRLDLAQFSGDEPPNWLEQLGARAYKALRPKDASGLAQSVRQYPRRTLPPAWLIDAYRPGEYGGTGQTADWSLAAGLAREAPIFLAGGLTPENVGEAVRQIRPWGVDVASGVEAAPGRKDFQQMKQFVAEVRKVEQEIVRC